MLAVLSAALVFGLAACSNDDEEAAQTGSITGGSPSTPASSESDPDAENSDEDADDVAHASGTECLVGTWLTDNKHVGAMLQGVAGDANVSEPTGEALATFSEDGRHSVTYKTWTFEMSQQGTTVEVVRDGTDSGTYRATEEGNLTTTDIEMGSVVSMTTPGGTHSTPGEPSTMTGTFTCQGTTLEVTADGATSIMYRQ